MCNTNYFNIIHVHNILFSSSVTYLHRKYVALDAGEEEECLGHPRTEGEMGGVTQGLKGIGSIVCCILGFCRLEKTPAYYLCNTLKK